ncbi:MAG: DNA-formamidopyrimidine glycosylase [Dehalococcoidales bacterium]|nr:DNA-formamidopyrimidine glycosylase [Dehalococcoidales bacterium]
MPELPEVETTINELRPGITGKYIRSVEVFTPGTIAGMPAERFCRDLAGRRILGIARRGKFLVLGLDGDMKWIVHLRMTGSLLLKGEDEKPGKFVRVIIHLNGGTSIHFRDVRRFGRMWLVDDEKNVVGDLGVEPLSKDFSPERLAALFKGRKTPVKNLLLDQKLIAGIGNMYADEALYRARIHPLRMADSLTVKEYRSLHEAIQHVLKKGIHNKGASTDTYLRPDGKKGGAQLEFQVAHRKGCECPVCREMIERISVGQRGTYFCPSCQKLTELKEQ